MKKAILTIVVLFFWVLPYVHAEDTKHLTEAAQKGNSEAQYKLGRLYFYGDPNETIAKDSHKALDWITKAATQGHLEAQKQLRLIYCRSEELSNVQQSTYWHEKIAERGDSKSQRDLGLGYYFGDCVPQNYTRALYWYKKAAMQGDSESQVLIAIMYVLGQGVPEDVMYAYAWYNLAAAQGDPKGKKGKKEMSEYLSSHQITEAQQLSMQLLKGD